MQFAIRKTMNIIPFFTTNKGIIATDWSDLMNNEVFNANVVPQFECLEYIKTEIVDLNFLNVQQEYNEARSGGVDANNINGLINEFRRGYRTNQGALIVVRIFGKQFLWDGYNRYTAATSLGIDDYPAYIYDLKFEWSNRVDDAYDIVSLSMNNHATAKAATIADFVSRGIKYCRRHENSLSKDEIFEWMSHINHSFNSKQTETITNRIYEQTTAANNVIPYPHPKNARAWVNTNLQQDPSVNPIVVCCKEDTYIERAHLQIMKNYIGDSDAGVDPIDMTDVLLYTKGTETPEDVEGQRQFGITYLNDLDELVINYAIKRLRNQRAYEIKGALPQINGLEAPDSLVNLV